MKSQAIALILLLSIVNLSVSMYDGKSKVVKLTTDNFDGMVLKSQELWFVEFYAPWCGHCQRLEPDWNKLAKGMEGIINIGAVDMTTDQSVGSPYGVQGFPTLKFFGADKSKPIDYNGDRSLNDLVSYAFQQARAVVDTRIKTKASSSGSNSGSGSAGGHGGHGHDDAGGDVDEKDVYVLTDADYEDILMNSEDLWIVEMYAPWCGHCKRLTPEWAKAATQLKGEVKLGKIDGTVNTKAAVKFDLQGYPTIKYFPPGKKSWDTMETYNGGRDASSIVEWAQEKKLQFKPVLKVDQITNQARFDELCKVPKGMCLIAFLPHIYDSSAEERHSEIEMLQEVQRLNRLNPISIAWAQGGDYYEFEESLALTSGYPSFVGIFNAKNKYTVMRGAFNRKNVENWVSNIVNGKEPMLDFKSLRPIHDVSKWDGQDHKPSYEDSDL